MIWSYYHEGSGDLCGFTYSGPPGSEESAAPEGHRPIPGRFNSQRSRVVHADDGFGNTLPVVVTRKPARPSDTESVTWEWDEVADEWVAHPTLAAKRSALRATRNAELQATDGASIAALEALLQGVLAALGHPLPAAAQQLLDHRDALRAMPQRPDFDSLSVADVPRYLGSTNTGR